METIPVTVREFHMTLNLIGMMFEESQDNRKAWPYNPIEKLLDKIRWANRNPKEVS